MPGEGAYAELQQARAGKALQQYVAANGLQDLSIGEAGERFDAAFASDMAKIARLD